MSSDSLTAPLPEAATAAGVGFGYGIAIAVGILVLISTIMLASYLCVRAKGGPRTDSLPIHHPAGFVGGHDAAAAVGLDGTAIASFPKFVYGVGEGGGGRTGAPRRPVTGPCPICLSEYEAGEELRVVPECGHGFHAGCVDEWLRVSATCPLCRSSPVPSAAATPVATPLSELVPLAVHAR